MTKKYLTTKHPFTMKSLKEEGFFSGYASIFNNTDQQGDKVMRGAFEKSLMLQKKNGVLPKMLWQHDPKEPIGLWTHMHEDEKGLYVEGQLLLDLQRGREAYTLMKKGALDGLSIGCQIKKASRGEKEEVRLLTEVALMEISLVTFAANDQAKVLSVKASLSNHDEKRVEIALKNALKILKEIS